MYTRSGVFRRFAFIGFSSGEEALSAVKYFNRTFIDTLRVEVELALAAGSEELPRAWSRYTKGSSIHQAYEERKEAAKVEEKKACLMAELERKKKLLEEIYGEQRSGLKNFVESMRPASKTKTWENDSSALSLQEKSRKRGNVQVTAKTVPNRKPGGAGQLVTSTHVKFGEDDEENEGVERESSDEEYEEWSALPKTNDAVDDNKEETQKEQEEAVMPIEQKREHSPADLIMDTGRLFLRNLAYSCQEEDLRRLFAPFGELADVHLSISRETKRGKGFAYILFVLPEDALKAYGALDGTIFQGRLLHILPAKEQLLKKETTFSSSSSSYKQQKEQELKKEAHKDHNWNSLFLRPDTVLDAIAFKLGVNKAALMETQEGEPLAVRLAVAETHLIQETKSYLEAEGVQLDAFSTNKEQSRERSDCILLVKNLPFDTDTNEIRKLFTRFGNVGRVVLPPSKAIALIEFFEASEARAAFRHLAYSRFHSAPLFLEWAPILCLRPTVQAAAAAAVVEPIRIIDNAEEREEKELNGSAPTLYVKNLNFSTVPDTLKTVFAAIGKVRSVSIASKRGPDGKSLSLGFGFVEFERPESLSRALDQLQGTVIDGHALLLKRSTQSSTANAKVEQRKKPEGQEDQDSCTKLIVRNVPFETSDKELRALFKSFGQLKKLRLPKRHDGRHRGFAFVEYLTHQEALNARNALAHTHLYGRHLVLEWARSDAGLDEDELVESLRKRTKARMNIGHAEAQEINIDGGDQDDVEEEED